MSAAIEQSREWQEAKNYVKQLTDGLGMPVDKKIADTVAILHLMGFHTTMSCSGHLRRITGGPYIMFISPKAEVYKEKSKEIADPKGTAYKTLYRRALKENLIEQQKLYPHLEQFYATRAVSFGNRLMLRTLGFSVSRLECQGADIARIHNMQTRRQILLDNQAEMEAFTDYLKKTYSPTYHSQ